MKRFAKSASAIALAGALALGATPAAFAQTPVTGQIATCDSYLVKVVRPAAATIDQMDRMDQLEADVKAYNDKPAAQRLDKAEADQLAGIVNAALVERKPIDGFSASVVAGEKVTSKECPGTVAPAPAGSSPLVPLSMLAGGALLSSGMNQEKPAEKPAPAPAPAPEKPVAPEKGIAPEKGVAPKAAPEKGVKPAEAAPAKRGVLAQTGATGMAEVVAMLGLVLAGAAAFVLRRKTA